MHREIDVETPYTVRLQDAGKITEEGRATAECNFTRAMEKTIGEENVVPSLRAFERIADSGRKPTKAQEAEAKAWQEAWEQCRASGHQGPRRSKQRRGLRSASNAGQL